MRKQFLCEEARRECEGKECEVWSECEECEECEE